MSTMQDEKTYIDLLPVIIEREGAVMPEGFDSWGTARFRYVHQTAADK